MDQAGSRGERVFLQGLPEVPVYVAAYWLKRDGGREKRFVLCTRALSPGHIVRWGKKRWVHRRLLQDGEGQILSGAVRTG